MLSTLGAGSCSGPYCRGDPKEVPRLAASTLQLSLHSSTSESSNSPSVGNPLLAVRVVPRHYLARAPRSCPSITRRGGRLAANHREPTIVQRLTERSLVWKAPWLPMQVTLHSSCASLNSKAPGKQWFSSQTAVLGTALLVLPMGLAWGAVHGVDRAGLGRSCHASLP